MKKITTLFIMAATALSLQSCDMLSSSGKYDLAQSEKITALKQEIDKNIKADDLVKNINFYVSNSSGFSNDPNMIKVNLAKPGQEKMVENVIINLTPELKVEREDNKYIGDIHSLPYSQYDLSTVPGYIAQAAQMIPTEEYEYGGIGNYDLRATDDGYVEHFFKLQVTPKSGATQIKGRRIETSYYEVEFKTDKDGKLNMLVEE